MKYTLLKMTQNILSAMGSDEVNSISDTTESMDVATTIEECYYDVVVSAELAEHDTLFKFEPSLDNLKPTVMYLPDNVQEVFSVKYNTGSLDNTNNCEVSYVPFHEFLRITGSLDTTDSYVSKMTLTINGDTYDFKYHTDRFPSIWSTPDDHTILFDSFKSSIEDTLTKDRILCLGSVIPKFKMEDTFVPDLDAQQFQLLIQSAKAQCFVEIKQSQNPKAEKKERRHRILAEKNKDRSDPRKAIHKRKGYGR